MTWVLTLALGTDGSEPFPRSSPIQAYWYHALCILDTTNRDRGARICRSPGGLRGSIGMNQEPICFFASVDPIYPPACPTLGAPAPHNPARLDTMHGPASEKSQKPGAGVRLVPRR
jgi:hypothetical protein